MTSKEALKRLKQETAPATYMPDFDKDKCIEIINQDLDRLEKIKGIFEDMKDARDNASFQQDDEVFLTIFTELSHWCEQLEEVLEDA